jgi:transposase
MQGDEAQPCWTLKPASSRRGVIRHEGNAVREFYSSIRGPVTVGIEATGAMHWFLELLEELGIESHVGDPAKIRAAETRKQKHDRREARLLGCPTPIRVRAR